jgi:hypothetical protein
MTSLALSRLALLSLLSPLLQNFAQTVYLSHPAASIEDNISAIKPYRDDPESTSSSFGVSLRRTAENSPVMEFEMHPIVNRQPKTSAITNTIKGHQPKLLLIVFVLMVGGYAISRHKPSNKVQQGLAAPATTNQVATGPNSATGALCGRRIPFDLFDTSTWPTPYTPSYYKEEYKPTDSSANTAILITFADTVMNIRSINVFFSAIDMEYEQVSCQLYITKTATWIWGALVSPFFGDRVERDDAFCDRCRMF